MLTTYFAISKAFQLEPLFEEMAAGWIPIKITSHIRIESPRGREPQSVEVEGRLCIAARHSRFMSAPGLGRVKTKSDLVVTPSGRQIFAFFCAPHDHRAPISGVRLYRAEFLHS